MKSKKKVLKVKPPKYTTKDMLYSYQNKAKKARVTKIRISDDPRFQHAYKLSLVDDKGYTYSSKWILESSLSKRKK